MQISWGVIVSVVAGAAGAAVPFLLRRKNPKEKERRRRELIGARGRTIEGFVIDSDDQFVFYTYEWRGVRYEASQDISDVLVRDGGEVPLAAGPVTVKFLPASPANSIVIAENWSGVPGALRRSLVRQR
jgi:hypothetical protein